MALSGAEKGSFRKLEGIVQISDAMPLETHSWRCLIILNTGWNPATHLRRKPKQHRLSACITSKDGRFCFSDLPDGKYELRSSLGTGIDVTHVIVVVKKKAGKTKTLEVEMHVGT